MNADEYRKMYEAEAGFWWFAGKGRMVADLAQKWFTRRGDFLDAGCGTGANLDRLAGQGHWTGLDLSRDALGFCAQRGRRALAAGAAGRLPFRDRAFDGATALDVFEHLEDDAQAAREIFRVLKPGGRLIATVPAHPWLWGAHDQALGHVRRYTDESFHRLLAGAGFKVLWSSHFMGLLFPAMALGKGVQKIFGDPGRTISYEWPGWINRTLLFIVEGEMRLLRHARMPAGTTLVAVAEKGEKV